MTDKEIRKIAEQKCLRGYSGYIDEQIQLDRTRKIQIDSFIEGYKEALKKDKNNVDLGVVVGQSKQLSLSAGGCYECPKCGKSLHVSDYNHDCNYANDKK